MSNLQGNLGELRFTLEIKRKETGKTEIYEMIGKVGEENGSNTQHSGTKCSDGCSNSIDRG